MFYDLFIPFPSSSSTAFQQPSSSQQQPKAPSKRSRKGAAAGGPASATGGGGEEEAKRVERERRMKEGCWFGVSGEDKERMESAVRMGRHLGYTVLSFAQTAHTRIEASSHYNPFYSSIPFTSAPTPSHLAPPSDPSPSSLNPAYPAQLPFPALDPRHASSKGESTAGRPVVQLSRLHLVLDDGSCGSGGTGYLSQNTSLLSQYDLLSLTPTTPTSFHLACLTLSLPGPNQTSIISLPFTHTPRGLPFHLKRKPVLAALRSGVVFEICYAPLLPGSSGVAVGSAEEAAARRNVLSGARDLVRITKGKGIVLSSGAAGWGSARGVQDVINLGTLMGMTPDQAHAAVCLTPKKVVLRAQARKTYRGVISLPKIIAEPPAQISQQTPEAVEGEMEVDG